MTAVERLKMRRREAKKRGDCSSCCTQPAEPNSVKCARCRNGHRRNDKQRAEQNLKQQAAQAPWCMECIACGFHRVDCPTRMVAA